MMPEPRCHHRIGPPHYDTTRDAHGRYAPPAPPPDARIAPLWQYCSLRAAAWCERHSYYVCSHHLYGPHAAHLPEHIAEPAE